MGNPFYICLIWELPIQYILSIVAFFNFIFIFLCLICFLFIYFFFFTICWRIAIIINEHFHLLRQGDHSKGVPRMQMTYIYVCSQPAFTCSSLIIKTLDKVWNMFKSNNKDTRTTPLASLLLIYQNEINTLFFLSSHGLIFVNKTISCIFFEQNWTATKRQSKH